MCCVLMLMYEEPVWCDLTPPGEARILCDVTIVSGRDRFGGLDSSGRNPYGVMQLLRERPYFV